MRKWKIPPMLGKHHSKETKRKLRDKSKGKHYSPKTEFKKGKHYSPITEFKKGNTPWIKGKGHSEETKRKMSLIRKRKPNKPNSGWFKKGRILSKEQKEKLLEANGKRWLGKNNPNFGGKNLKGEKHWNWKGGLTPLIIRIRHSFRYRQWRSDVFTRDNFTCQECGKRGGWVEADHYPKRFSDIFYDNKIKTLEEALDCEELWNINNGRTLCRECHNKTKGKKPYRNHR